MTTDVQSCTKKSRGRPKVFDREAALDKAMTLFWQHGYEATSLADLVEATGAKAPTLYAEFVNKEGLFRAVLDRYISRFAAKHEAQLFCEEKSVELALKDYFTAVATCFSSKETPAGCFMINTSASLAASSNEIARTLKSRHAMQEQTLQQFLTQRQQRGEIPAEKDINALAQFLSCILQGMSISAREGASLEVLMQITNTTLRLWPEMLKL
ncbi:MAG: TetR/AcrR family transcriptional regulator [Yokenella regensburgei]|jgi:AcrR family transcriptional regulator|uniref:Bacterial regulatory proteins, tetR family n=1 Tax=Yokenella regensburgei TaxID=158877 RepID=A0AB38FQZ8_9ENTR|nr:TetR/AcrR family transcriptional regulator [Yokenella regensburgei]EHM47295.1 transcriptional regulator, TetR family [Yokenella regensburgei ATCC 43003]KAF1371355.1 AcrR family transcriptional regulator [Yokenella regensburgei]KFD19567.1 TetR family transcriptional regulator [Yokenella regensburgei ATCC 49455]MDQ4431765.1 TetR/AcrR family transcriptional regulator [Yokenella regensburgei]MDR3106318.1 TetR/AcrR family transcriptional regulator [Yokenella regensburgei]